MNFTRLYLGATNRTFGSLSHRDFRFLWMGTSISQIGEWMDMIALNWLVMEMTGSPLYLGLVNLAKAIPILIFTLLGGVAADRLDKRRVILLSQGVTMVLALTLGVLVSTNTVQLWQVFIIAALRGLVMSFNLPARQALISDLVPRESLANAVALHVFTIQFTRILGPAVAGVLIAASGVATSFYVNGVGFMGAFWLVQAMRVPARADSRAPSSVSGSLFEGLRFIAKTRIILWLVLAGLVPTFFAQPFMALLTVFARDVLVIGPTGLGLLTAAAATGAAIGGLIVASLGSSGQRGTVMLGAMTSLGMVLILFSASTHLYLSLLLLLVAGMMSSLFQVTASTLLQLSVPDEMRGRVVSTLYLARGLVPTGTALAGALATVVGIQMAQASMASVVVLLGVGVTFFVPQLRRLHPGRGSIGYTGENMDLAKE